MDATPNNPATITGTLQPACAVQPQPIPAKITPFNWSKVKRRAAALVAADELTDRQLARRLDINRSTLYDWKRHPDFAARVHQLREKLGQLAERYTIGRRAARLSRLQDLENRLWHVVKERAADPQMKEVAGGDSGLLVHRVDEYAVDTALSRELRDIYKQAAVETGQWVEKTQQTGLGNVVNLQIEIIPAATQPADTVLVQPAPRQIALEETPRHASAPDPAVPDATGVR